MAAMSQTATPKRPPRRRRKLLIGLAVLLVVALVAGLVGLQVFGPRFGIWLIKPGPQGYAEYVLEYLDEGYYAEGAEWEQARAALLDTAVDAPNYVALYPAIMEATAAAGGSHSYFLTPEQAGVADSVAVAEFQAPTVATADGITTITIGALGNVTAEQQQQYADNGANGIIAAAPDTCGWIVDLRQNMGGNMYPMFAAVAPLLPDGPAMTFLSRTGESQVVQIADGGAGFGDGPVTGTDVREKVTGQQIAVLYDDRTASSGEAVATVFRGLDGVRAFGTPTAGYSSANMVVRMPDGALLVITQAVYVDRDGVNLNEQPIPPDELTSAADAPAAAAAWLRQGSCG